MAEADVIGNKSAIIKTALNEYTKSKQVFDVLGRLEYLYVAGLQAKNNDPCITTRYSYIADSSNVDYVKEYEGKWLTSFETF
jgi:hypothetical protein